MRGIPFLIAAAALAASQAQAAPAPVTDARASNAAQTQTLDGRVERLERLLDSRSLVDMLTRIETQQRELAQMRGEVEQLRHELESLKQRQRDLYLDTDRRLSRVEREGVPATDTVSPPAAAPAPSDVPSVPPASATDAPATAAPDSGPAAAAAAPVSTGPTPADLAAERKAYQQAFDILRELRYEQAITAFRDFLTRYPSGRYAHIAQYWMGEANYASGKYQEAITAYQGLTENHPNSPKVAEALLKIGYSYRELGRTGEAKAVFERLLREYPDTTEAGQAQGMLKRLGQQAG